MKQVLQHLRTGETQLAEVPAPRARENCVAVTTSTTLISAGTERMLVDFSRSNLLDKARQQPDKVREVLQKVRTDGLLPTIEAVTSKLDQPMSLGYCNVGAVREVGAGVGGFAVGDRVVSNGNHAEVVCVPGNLCAKIPNNVPDDHAAFTVVGAIALQGIRLLQPTLGENVVVTGLGLIGLIAVQLLRANGCRVLGVDFSEARLELARQFGAETVNLGSGQDPVDAGQAFSRGRGVDAVLITAATTSNEPVAQAANMSRKRGRIVLVGTAGLELSRADFYEKELSFQVSCSYGPGRYDPAYEEKGNDYPFGFVRWTEQRNFEAVLDLLSSRQLDVEPLITHRYALDNAVEAYAALAADSSALGIVLEYEGQADDESAASERTTVELRPERATGSRPVTGVLGAGNYAGRVLIPEFRRAGVDLNVLVSNGSATAAHYANKLGFRAHSTDSRSIFDDESISTVVVATRHDSHARYVINAIESGKHVFVEKPLCLTSGQLDGIREALSINPVVLTVGFNRRFSPLVLKMRQLLMKTTGPKTLVMTVNAGQLPADHWTRDPAVGGGRVVGEACHFVDLLRHLADCPITDFWLSGGIRAASSGPASDNVIFNLQFEDGSIGSVQYIATGHKSYPKERLEVFAGGKVLQLDNFRRLTGWGWKGFSSKRLLRQDKGQQGCVAAFVEAVEGSSNPPIAYAELFEVSLVSIELADMAH